MELADSQRVHSVVTRVPLRDINEAFQRLASGRVRGRQVIEIHRDTVNGIRRADRNDVRLSPGNPMLERVGFTPDDSRHRIPRLWESGARPDTASVDTARSRTLHRFRPRDSRDVRGRDNHPRPLRIAVIAVGRFTRRNTRSLRSRATSGIHDFGRSRTFFLASAGCRPPPGSGRRRSCSASSTTTRASGAIFSDTWPRPPRSSSTGCARR